MNERDLSLYECAVYGVQAALDNVRLFVLSACAFIVTIVALVMLLGLVAGQVIFPAYHLAVDHIRPLFLAPDIDPHQYALIKMEFFKELAAILSTNIWMSVICSLLVFIAMVGMTAGFTRVLLDLKSYGKSEVPMMYSKFHLIPKFLLLMIISSVAIVAGTLFFILPGIYLLIKLYFCLFYMIDRNAGVIESLRNSFAMTDGFEWEIFGMLVLSYAALSVFSILALPFVWMMGVAMYKYLVKGVF